MGSQTGNIWEQTELAGFMKGTGNAPLLNLANTAPILYSNNYITIHDLAFYHHPEWNSKLFSLWYNWMMPRIAEKAKHVFTVSETIKSELIRYYQLPEAKISVTYNGLAQNMLEYGGRKPKEKIILSVGTFNLRKNHHRLLQAFLASDLKEQFRLVMVGDRNKIFKETLISPTLLEHERIIFKQHIDDAELMDLYETAEIVVSLSSYEGFGIPLLEGLYFGCKIVCSDIPVYRELFEGYAAFCDPTNTQSIITAISETSNTSKEPPNISGLLNKYSYERAAETILNRLHHQ